MSEFCETCDVTMDLHDDPDDCEQAEALADRQERLDRMFMAAIFGGGQ